MKYIITLVLFSIIFSINVFAQGIQITLSPDTLTLAPGQSQQVTVNITPSGGFNQQVFMFNNCSGNCSGLSLTFSSNPAIFPYVLDFTLNVGGNAILGSNDFLIIGSNGPVSDTAIFHLDVLSNNCVFSQPASFLDDFDQLLATQNGVWLGGFHTLGNYSPGSFTTGNSPFPGHCLDLFEDALHNTWIATFDGIIKYDGTYWSLFDTSNTIFDTPSFSSIASDSSNNIWVTASINSFNVSGGIYKYDGTTWIKYDSLNNNLPCNNVSHITFDRNGLLWAFFYSYTTNTYYPFNFDGVNWTPVSWPYNCVPIIDPTSISFDSQNNAWFGTGNNLSSTPDPQLGLYKHNGATIELWSDSVLRPFNHFIYDTNCNLILEDSSSQIPAVGIHNVFVDHTDRVWVATMEDHDGKGIVLINGNNFTTYNNANSLLGNNSVYDISESNDTIYLLSGSHFFGGNSYLSTFTCSSTIDVPSIEKTNDLILFPNPSRGNLKIDFQNNLFSLSTLKIFDLTGKIVYETVLHSSSEVIQLNLPNGFYNYRIENRYKMYTGKVVINKN